MSTGRFGTAINCIDGRAQLPVLSWLRERFDLDYVDMVTEPGPDGMMAAGRGLESIKSRVIISLNAHGSKVLALVSHHDCAGNPVTKERHFADNRKGLDLIRAWNLPGVQVIGLWVTPDWKVELIEG